MQAKRHSKTLRTSAVLAATLSFALFGGAPLAARSGGADRGELAKLGEHVDPDIADLLGASERLGVDWAKLFDAKRDRLDFVHRYGGVDAIVLEDNISAGVALDMSALKSAETLADSLVYNGTVAPQHDLGNAYIYSTFDAAGNLVLYAGVERLAVLADSWIEFEFNQDRVRVTTGEPWPIHGERTTGDLLVRVNIVQGVVASVEVKRWAVDPESEAGAFVTIGARGGLIASACDGEPTRLLFCSGRAPVAAWSEVWDAAGRPVEPVAPDSFVEIGANVGSLLGGYVDFTSIQVRSPEDIILGSFRRTGYWGRKLNDAK